MAWYLGKRGEDDLIVFHSACIPKKESHGHLYMAVIGPFKSRLGAGYFARYGRNDPALHTAADVEHLARTDPRMEQDLVEERMTDEELAIALECDAQDQFENSPTISQGEISCPTGLKTN